MRPSVGIARTGVANLASVRAAFGRLGTSVTLIEDADGARRADRVVLPGVGAFAAGAAALGFGGLGEALVERVRAGRPLLAICLGLQLLGERSDESPGMRGLGLLPTVARRFARGVRIPQLGWNRVEPDPGARLLAPGHAYFANSYRLADPVDGWIGAWSTHGERFLAAIERGPLLACQFHPELSGRYGHDLLARWLAC